jgi:hypothetical protein
MEESFSTADGMPKGSTFIYDQDQSVTLKPQRIRRIVTLPMGLALLVDFSTVA